MKLKLCILAALLVLIVSGCGLVSGTAFISQKIDGRITAQTDETLDGQFAGDVVDLTDNGDWSDFTIEGVEDGCIALDAWNKLSTPATGEIWITEDTTLAARSQITSVADIIAAGGFRVFHGIALEAGPDNPADPNDAQHFGCAETIDKLENVEQLVEMVQRGYFVAWGAGNEDEYDLEFDGLIIGIHVTGSL